MKTLKCDICDHEAQGETFGDWMNAMKPHYAEAHADVMNSKSGLTDVEKKEEMGKWVAENRQRFEAV